MRENAYVDLVREFYLNLSYSNGTIKSFVKDIEIVLDPVHLEKILHLPCVGYKEMELTRKE